MKKYKALYKIGETTTIIGFILMIMVMTIDGTKSDDAMNVLITMTLISIAVILLGRIFCNIGYLEGVAVSIFLVSGAMMYKLLKKPMKFFRECYNIKQHSGSYRKAFSECRKAYSDYIHADSSEDQ